MKEEVNNTNDLKLLNKKRKNSHSKRRHSSHRRKKINQKSLIQNNIFGIKNIDYSRQKIQHFFHFNWEDDLYEKKTIKISKYIDSSLYWYIINSSYFIENNIENNIKIINSNYLGKEEYISNDKENKIENENVFVGVENNNNSHDNVLVNLDNNKKCDKSILSIISLLNFDKNGKYYPSFFDNETNKKNSFSIKKKLLLYINSINKINEKRINYLNQKARFIQKEYNSKNHIEPSKKETINLLKEEIEENYMYSKNIESLNIRMKFWDYIFKKEKSYLIKRDSKNRQYETNNVEEDEEIFNNNCYICNCGDLGQYDNLYECTQCGIKVHQECYGNKLNADPSKWKCSKCKKLSYKEAINLECFLCPCKGGAMKQTKISKESYFYQKLMKLRGKNDEENDYKNNINNTKLNSSNIKPHSDSPWIHLSCAFGNKCVKINVYDKKKNFKFDEENIIKKYNERCCYICKLSNYGPTIKCKMDDCETYFHPECARTNNYYIEKDNTNYFFYCHKHRPNRFIKFFNKLSKSYNNEIFFFGDVLECMYKLYNKYKNKEFYPSISYNEKENNDDKDNEINLLLEEDENENKFSKNKINKIKRRKKFSKNKKKFIRITNTKKEEVLTTKSIYQKDESPKKDNYKSFSKNTNNNSFNKNSHSNKKNDKSCYSSRHISHKPKRKETNINNEKYMLENNLNDNKVNSVKNNKSSESFSLTLEEKKKIFVSDLKKYLEDFFKINRIFCKKEDNGYSHPKEEVKEEFLYENLSNFTIEDFKNGKYDGDKKLNEELLKRYEDIFKDENDFNECFEKKIDESNENPEKDQIKSENISNKKDKSKGRYGKSKNK